MRKATRAQLEQKRILWQPQPKQIEFMQRPEYEVFYGGAAGGGKSDSLLIEALRQVEIPHYKGLIIRKTFPQLSELIDRSMELYQPAFRRARYNGTDHVWKFPSGAKIYFGSMHHMADRIKYQGKRYDFVGFDELTHFTWDEYSYLFSRNRPSGPGTRVYMRATGNPGGIGHGWVKNRFITAAPPKTRIWEEYKIAAPNGQQIEMKRDRIFIPSSVFDNPALLQNNPEYLASLAMMSEKDKRALLYGDWDSFQGQVFSEWRDDPAGYDTRRWSHVIRPFQIPEHWKVVRGFDFGFSRPFSVGWYAVNEQGVLYRIAEYYGCTGVPNEGVKLNPKEIVAGIREMEETHPQLAGREISGVADPSIFEKSRGESIAEQMEQFPYFITWDRGDNNRLAGKMQFHYRLAFDAEGRSMFYCFDTCKHFIRTIPNLVYDETKVEDVDTDGEDHIYDECRYVFMTRPITPRSITPKLVPLEDPLNLCSGEKKDGKYQFYKI